MTQTPLTDARRARTRLQAARLHQTLEAELSLNDNLTEDWVLDAEAAIQLLESHYPLADLRDTDISAGRGGWVPPLSPDARAGEAKLMEEVLDVIPHPFQRVAGIGAAAICIAIGLIVVGIILAGIVGIFVYVAGTM